MSYCDISWKKSTEKQRLHILTTVKNNLFYSELKQLCKKHWSELPEYLKNKINP